MLLLITTRAKEINTDLLFPSVVQSGDWTGRKKCSIPVNLHGSKPSIKPCVRIDKERKEKLKGNYLI